jgi:hypothetical protein
VIAGTLALLRIVICSMSLPTRTCAPGPGQGNPIAPPGHPRITVTRFTFPVRALTVIRLLSESDRIQGELDNRPTCRTG